MQVPAEAANLLHSLEQEWIDGTSIDPSERQALAVGGTQSTQAEEDLALASQALSQIELASPWHSFAASQKSVNQKRMRQTAEGFS